MINLKDVTLVLIDCVDVKRSIESLKASTKYYNISYAAVKYLTYLKVDDKLIENTPIEVVKIPPIKSIESYSKFVVLELWKYFDTSHVLITQHDSWVINPNAWTDEFLEYSYIGSVWWWWHDGKNPGIGNGGFSLRSKKLMERGAEIGKDNIKECHPEDNFYCFKFKKQLIEEGFKWPSLLLAEQFSIESRPYNGQFGHHQGVQVPFK